MADLGVRVFTDDGNGVQDSRLMRRALEYAGPLGVVISYEVFFAERARVAAAAGGHLLLVPTNAASFHGDQVPNQEIAAARLRAIETGRDVVQVAPTGHSAFIDAHGRVTALSALGAPSVAQHVVRLRTARTPYVRLGERPVVALAVLSLVEAWIVARRRAGSDRPPLS